MTTIADQNTDYPPPPAVTLEILRDMVLRQRQLIDRLIDENMSIHADTVTLRHDLEVLRLARGKRGRK